MFFQRIMSKTREEMLARRNFKRNIGPASSRYDEKNKFKCTIYFLKLHGLTSIKHCENISAQIKFILQRSNVPLYNVLDIKYPIDHSIDSAVLYFTNYHVRNYTKKQIENYLKEHFANNIIVD